MGAVSDHQNWQAPSGSQPPPPTTPVSPYGGQPGPAAPAMPLGAPAPAGAVPPGWTPPPKPGLVPLRPMTLGTILGASFQVMRRNPRTTLVPALIVSVLLALIAGGGTAAYIGAFSRVLDTNDPSDASAFVGGALIIAALTALVTVALAIAAVALLQGIVVAEVARGTVGEKLRLGDLWRQYKGRFGVVVGYTALIVLAILVGTTIVMLLIFGLSAAVIAGSVGAGPNTPDPAAFAALGFGMFGIFLLAYAGAAVLGAWLGTKLAFVPAAIVLERRSIRASIARSWRLTRGFFWRTFGIMLLVGVMITVATNIVSAPISMLFSLGSVLVDPTGASSTDPSAMLGTMSVMVIVMYAAIAVVTAIGLVVQSATSSLLYLDLRMRREGLDLELARYVEARQAGVDVPDPYLPRPETPAPAPTPAP